MRFWTANTANVFARDWDGYWKMHCEPATQCRSTVGAWLNYEHDSFIHAMETGEVSKPYLILMVKLECIFWLLTWINVGLSQ